MQHDSPLESIEPIIEQGKTSDNKLYRNNRIHTGENRNDFHQSNSGTLDIMSQLEMLKAPMNKFHKNRFNFENVIINNYNV